DDRRRARRPATPGRDRGRGMSVAACLLFYSFAVAVLGPRLLVRLTRAGAAPRLGVAAWLVAIGSVVASWAVAAAFLANELVRAWTRPGDTVISACFAMLRQVAVGRYGLLVQIGLLVLTALATLALAVLLGRLGRSLVRARASTHQHARLARLAGRHLDGVEAVVLDAPERAAYCVAGRPNTIVVTSAALDALDQRHLDAVLCHERAHLAGRHHLILAVLCGLAAILPRFELFTTGAAEVARLLEMCADDTAARAHGARTVLGALLALSGAAPTPTDALGATGIGVLARATRLAAPPRPVDRIRMRLSLTAVSVLLVVGPVLTVLLTAAGLALCDPMAI
ncbi:MAG: M56 family metallopeptidase, partial [Actinobacteria bacterium]|nr:M56 family metallopeptidase [Actinomycetota bacterium]